MVVVGYDGPFELRCLFLEYYKELVFPCAIPLLESLQSLSGVFVFLPEFEVGLLEFIDSSSKVLGVGSDWLIFAFSDLPNSLFVLG